jgi:peptidoglycan/xylan/chitin deacetylase (PgdA/CDA1 family)
VVDDPAAHSKVKVRIASKYSLARLSGIPRLLNWLNRNCLLVLTYHGIYDGPKAPGRMPDTFVHVGDMEAQLKEIKRRYHIIEPDHLLESLEKGSSLPPHSALITFDDGYESFHRLAFPVLQELGIRSIVFVATQYVEDQKPFYFDLAWLFVKCCSEIETRSLVEWLGINEDGLKAEGYLRAILMKMKRMLPEPRSEVAERMQKALRSEMTAAEMYSRLLHAMNKKQIKQIASEGVFLGAHTHSHTIMNVLSKEMNRKEVLENKKWLETEAKRACHFFAYPNGGKADYNSEHKEILAEAGFRAAFSMTQERAPVHENALDLSRINASPEDTLQSLLFRCTGISPWLEEIRNGIRSGGVNLRKRRPWVQGPYAI